MSIYGENFDLNSDFTTQQYSQPPLVSPVPIIEGGNTVVTTINGASGSSINFTSGIGFAFSGSAGGDVQMTVSNAALVRSSIGAAASGVNTDITQLNGASQVDVSSDYKVSGTQVVGAQGAAVPDATGAGDVVAQLNTLLARLRAHGLISP